MKIPFVDRRKKPRKSEFIWWELVATPYINLLQKASKNKRQADREDKEAA